MTYHSALVPEPQGLTGKLEGEGRKRYKGLVSALQGMVQRRYDMMIPQTQARKTFGVYTCTLREI